MHCKANCGRLVTSTYRTIIIPHPEDKTKTTTTRVLEDLCNVCGSIGDAAAKGEDWRYENDIYEDLTQLGLDINDPSCLAINS